jgi:hypothetical protein
MVSNPETFVVSAELVEASNHALCARHQCATRLFFTRKAWFDKLTTNGLFFFDCFSLDFQATRNCRL